MVEIQIVEADGDRSHGALLADISSCIYIFFLSSMESHSRILTHVSPASLGSTVPNVAP